MKRFNYITRVYSALYTKIANGFYQIKKSKVALISAIYLCLLASPSAFSAGEVGITLAQANQAIAAAITRAERQGTLMNIAVVDAGANLVSFVRMDGSFIGSIDIAIKKAKTARLFNMPTADLGKQSQPGKPLYNIELSNGGLISFGGGLPIYNSSGDIIGAIGVSGGTVMQDKQVAKAGVQAI